MIVVRLLGGLGNQMFQYAAGRRLAESRRTNLALDISGFRGYQLRRYELDAFSIPEQIITLPQIDAWARECAGRKLPFAYVKEPHFHFHPALLSAPGDAFLEGYWQCERYFADIAPLLRETFTVRLPLDERNQAFLAAIQRAEGASVSVHVRRTDYVDNPKTNSVHGTCDLDYYDTCVKRMCARVTEPQFFVFSDDPAWVTTKLLPRIPAPCTVVAGNGDRGALDLHLMRHCKNHILANSSFSWWGAWLDDSPDKRVMAPRRWFVAEHLDPRDLIPSGWERV
jgi:hypothetical protein